MSFWVMIMSNDFCKAWKRCFDCVVIFLGIIHSRIRPPLQPHIAITGGFQRSGHSVKSSGTRVRSALLEREARSENDRTDGPITCDGYKS